MTFADTGYKTETPDDRPLTPAILRGLRCKCPACGEASMLQGFLKVADTCPACGEDLSHQRADDGPAYLTMLVTLKTVTPMMVAAMFLWDLHPAVLFSLFATLLVALSLFLLPRFKGMIVAIQWSRRMHGFEGKDARQH
ncbi:DUF983 domain-containing protein [Natronohydrobacter thiooxidans]|jgi:uncharacterized protein (DUF983 family)|uniref:DUF983 domain-containing protein n=1 Tax=Natronohydrobacter thiooxidans TaxID=87172 RepID=UPI0008FF1D54|nr:DUF983 domain-containing protein [Natronohydrobacter thiooxidans]